MATSRSGKKERTWIAGVWIYSGRHDPTWSVPGRLVKKLQKLWESLPPAGEEWKPPSGGLGYRGSFLRGPGNREWAAFKGLVSLRTHMGMQVREDVTREFERTLISSAPRGVLPEGLIEGPWASP